MTFENRGKIYNNITETIGATPLVRLNRLPEQYDVSAEILLKLEFFNPMASVKDRIGVAMIEDLENRGLTFYKHYLGGKGLHRPVFDYLLLESCALL